MRAAILGGSGYVGGELLRLLLEHPRITEIQAASDRLAGKPVHVSHPNLRGRATQTYVRYDAVRPCDAVFLARPHKAAMRCLPEWIDLAPRIIDLSADFRLHDLADYETYYGLSHPQPEWLNRFVFGLPELNRAALREATHVAVPGCMATAAILAIHPLTQAGLVRDEVVVDARTGSSGSGSESGPDTHHAERSGAMRVFAPVGHRHEAEIRQACSVSARMTATGVEAVRGVQIIAHLWANQPVTEKDVWKLYRQAYGPEPFVRLVKQHSGLYRLPEPKILSGSNYCDVGFAVAADGRHLVAVAALDNLVKGGAGNAVQCLNILCGWDECEGLGFPGLHPM